MLILERFYQDPPGQMVSDLTTGGFWTALLTKHLDWRNLRMLLARPGRVQWTLRKTRFTHRKPTTRASQTRRSYGCGLLMDIYHPMFSWNILFKGGGLLTPRPFRLGWHPSHRRGHTVPRTPGRPPSGLSDWPRCGTGWDNGAGLGEDLEGRSTYVRFHQTPNPQ